MCAQRAATPIRPLDMVDPVKNQLVWEGTATNRVTDSLRRNQEQAINDFIKAIFEEFPR